MNKMLGISATNLLNRSNEDEDYFKACERAEVKVLLKNENEYRLVKEQLFYDKRDKGGANGRGMKIDFSILNF